MSETHDICACCGAPRTAGHAACKFCGTVFARAQQTSIQDNAIPCPKCRTLNEWGAQRCVQCQTWVVVQCVFCSAISPCHLPACLQCHEPFAGAPERLQQRQAQQQSQQRMAMLGTVGNVAASFLGAAAGVAVSGAWSGEGYRHHGQHHHHGAFDRDQGSGGGIFGAVTGSDDASATGGWDASNSGGSGGGLMDSLLGGGDAAGSSSDSTGDAGGGGGGLMDDLFGGSGSDDS